jgi:glutaredoxin
MKTFMQGIRAVLGPIILLWDNLFPPASLAREPQAQARVDAATEPLALYQLRACPFCVKVRRQMKRLGLTIETRDTRRNERWRDELLREGGSPKVPCLRIEENGETRWLYESSAINQYLTERFSEPAEA